MTNSMTVWGTALARPVSGDRDHIRGPVDAPVSLVEYGDFECPFCGAARGVVDAVQAAAGDLLQFVYRHFPLTTVHPHAWPAAEAAEAAGAQGQYWPMHDLLFDDQRHLAPADLVARARALRLNVDQFEHEVATHAHAGRVEEDFVSGVHSGVNGTPSFFVNGFRYQGPTDAATMIAVIEAALSPVR
jgi:protein-disulfide isomerase